MRLGMESGSVAGACAGASMAGWACRMKDLNFCDGDDDGVRRVHLHGHGQDLGRALDHEAGFGAEVYELKLTDLEHRSLKGKARDQDAPHRDCACWSLWLLQSRGCVLDGVRKLGREERN